MLFLPVSGDKQFLQGLLLRATPLILRNAGRTVPQRKGPRIKSFSSHKLMCTGDVLSIFWDKEGFVGSHPCCRGAWSGFLAITSGFPPMIPLFPLSGRCCLSLHISTKAQDSLVASGVWQQCG